MMHPARSKISVYGMRENLKVLEKRFRMLETQIIDVNVGKKKPIALTALRGVAQETGALAFDMGIQGMLHVFGETNQASSASKYLEQMAHSVVEVNCGAKLDFLNARYGGNVLEQIAKTTGSVVMRATELEGEDAVNTVLISRGRRDVGSVSVAHDQLLSLLNRISEVTVGNRLPLVTEKFPEIAEQTDCFLGHDNKGTAFIAGGYNQVEEAMSKIADVMDTCEEVRIGMVLPAILNESSEEIIEIAENTGTRIVADSEKLVFVLSGSEIQREAAKAELTKISECIFERRLGIRLCDSLRDKFNEVAEKTGARVRVHRGVLTIDGDLAARSEAAKIVTLELLSKKRENLNPLPFPPKPDEWILIIRPEQESWDLFMFIFQDEDTGYWCGHLARQEKRDRRQFRKKNIAKPFYLPETTLESGKVVPLVSKIKPDTPAFFRPFLMTQLKAAGGREFRYTVPEWVRTKLLEELEFEIWN